MDITTLYTKKELLAWKLTWFLFLIISIQRGGTDFFETRTPSQNTSQFCRAYVSGDLR
jgi:hypothetical protein